MLIQEIFDDGFQNGELSFTIRRKVIYDGLKKKRGDFIADIERADELLERRRFKTKQGAIRFLEKWNEKHGGEYNKN